MINKFGIKDEKKLSQMETLITTAKCQELEISPIVGDFGFDHYKAIHKYIFEDLYDWAGKVRTASISKKGTVFTLPESIEPLADRIFSGLQKNNCYIGYDNDRYIDYYLSENNFLASITGSNIGCISALDVNVETIVLICGKIIWHD